MSGAERRRFVRYPFGCPVQIQYGSQVLQARTRLISIGGMFVEHPEPLWVGASFSAKLLLPDTIAVDCVVRVVEAGQGMGVEFVELSPEARAQLEELVARVAVP